MSEYPLISSDGWTEIVQKQLQELKSQKSWQKS